MFPKPPSDVGRDDVDLVFRDAGDDRERRPVDVWGLRCDVELQAPHRVEVRDTPARLERRRMAALEPDPLAHALRAGVQRPRRALPVADLPVVDVVGLALAVGPQEHLVLLGGERIGDDRQRLVLHLHGLGPVFGRAPRLGEHGGHLLVLEQHFADGEHHLLVVAVERRQPPEARGLQVLAGDDRDDARDLHRVADIDRLDLRVGIGAAHENHVQHAWQHDVFDVIALALEEARILLALHPVTEGVSGLGFDAHRVPPITGPPRRAGAACPPPAARP